MKKNFTILLLAAAALTGACADGRDKKIVEENAAYAVAQTRVLLANSGAPNGRNFPRSTRSSDGSFIGTSMYDWTSGFFPGTLWYIHELTGSPVAKGEAEKWTGALDSLKTYRGTHDIGFMIYCSFGNAERLDPRQEYRDVIVEASESLISRYNPQTRTIRSWNSFKGWDDTRYGFPVIIDNMMNLEMLFAATRITGDRKYYDIAVAHADATLENHFRDDFSTYHVVGYDPETGEVEGRKTWQGYSDNSTWARGQAWAIYGFTMTYRETRDQRYLDAATRAADWYLERLPEDMIPFWDFNVEQEGFTPDYRSYAVEYTGADKKDASAAAIVCSALFELAELSGNAAYSEKALAMLESLASPAYRAPVGENGGFMIMHCTGGLPQHVEIDVPLVYADYYFMESLVRYNKL